MKINDHNEHTNGNRNSSPPKETPEQWWARISAGQRSVAWQIAQMMEEVTADKRIEIRKELEKIKARFVHILKKPEDGCLSAIMLPELTPEQWN